MEGATIKLPFNPDLPPASRCKQQQPQAPTCYVCTFIICRGFTSDLDSTLSTLPLYNEGLCKSSGYEMSVLRREETYHHTTSLPLLLLAQPCKGYMICRIVLSMTLSVKCGLSMVVRMMMPDFARSLSCLCRGHVNTWNTIVFIIGWMFVPPFNLTNQIGMRPTSFVQRCLSSYADKQLVNHTLWNWWSSNLFATLPPKTGSAVTTMAADSADQAYSLVHKGLQPPTTTCSRTRCTIPGLTASLVFLCDEKVKNSIHSGWYWCWYILASTHELSAIFDKKVNPKSKNLLLLLEFWWKSQNTFLVTHHWCLTCYMFLVCVCCLWRDVRPWSWTLQAPTATIIGEYSASSHDAGALILSLVRARISGSD